MRALVVDIPKRLWLTSNRHTVNRPHRAAIVRDLHALAAACAMTQHLQPAAEPVSARWEVRYPRGVRTDKGDASNAQPTTKAILDGLVPRWLPDDGPRWVASETFLRGPNLDVPAIHRITLTLEKW